MIPAAFELLAAIRKLPDKLHAVMVSPLFGRFICGGNGKLPAHLNSGGQDAFGTRQAKIERASWSGGMSMFDKQSIEAYRNIKAPEELREKVMRLNPELSSPGSNHRSKNAMLRPIAAVACAAVFCLAVSFSFWNQKDAALLYQGIPVEGEPAVIAADMPQSAALVRDSVPSGIL